MRKPYTWRARLVRIFALDRNKLRRWSDRIEAWLLVGLMITFVPLASVAATSAARWIHADGVLHTGAVPAVSGTKAGTSVQIWIDAAGGSATAADIEPAIGSRRAGHGGGALAVALGMLLGWCGLRWLLDRRRLAAWGESWSLAGPTWTR
jgi:hypothetical protein